VGTVTLLIVIVIVSAIGLSSRRLLEWAMLRPYLVARGGGYATLVTSGFIHADVGHLLLNLITFYSMGFGLERVIGTGRFLALYFCGLLVSGLASCLKHRNDPNYATLGASGAISAVLFAAIVYFPSSRLVIFPIPIPLPAPLFAVGYLAVSYYLSRNSRAPINHDAHIAGALTGLAFVSATDPRAVENLLAYLGG
jgi:membrane associated rhomboid family serine protease